MTQKPDIVILETGANDGLRGIPPAGNQGKHQPRPCSMLQEGKMYSGACRHADRPESRRRLYTSDFADIYPSVAEEQECFSSLLFSRTWPGNPPLNQDDTIHPNEKGHEVIVETIYPYILRAIEAYR